MANGSVQRRRLGFRALVLAVLLGLFFGLSLSTFDYAEGTSYLSNDPNACVNCHVMRDQFDGWQKAAHHARATCNDCHVPHDSIVSKYYVKAEHGYRHSKGFTFQDFHEPIQITKASRDVVIQNCVRCHEDMTHEIRVAAVGPHADSSDLSGSVDCIHCHTSVAHGPRR